LFGKINHISADDIYATNANRKYSNAAHIVSNFKRKGRVGKHEEHRQILSRELRKEKAALGQRRNIMAFRKLKPGQKRMKSFGSSSGFTQQMQFT
jgi:hypothetical protein